MNPHRHNQPTVGELREVTVEKPRRWWQSKITIACAIVGAICAIIQSLGAGATFVEWCADLIKVPGEVKNITARTTKAIVDYDAANQQRLDQVRELIMVGDSNTVAKVECLRYQFQKMRDSNDSDHAQIRAGQMALKANQSAVMHALDNIVTNKSLLPWQQYGLLPGGNPVDGMLKPN